MTELEVNKAAQPVSSDHRGRPSFRIRTEVRHGCALVTSPCASAPGAKVEEMQETEDQAFLPPGDDTPNKLGSLECEWTAYGKLHSESAEAALWLGLLYPEKAPWLRSTASGL